MNKRTENVLMYDYNCDYVFENFYFKYLQTLSVEFVFRRDVNSSLLDNLCLSQSVFLFYQPRRSASIPPLLPTEFKSCQCVQQSPNPLPTGIGRALTLGVP